jgi:hypothetical protein
MLPDNDKVSSLMAQLGKRAVYHQTGFLVPVTIEEICCGSHFFVSLATIDGLCLVSSPGAPALNPVFQIAAAWEYLAVDSKSWSFSCSGYWRLKLDAVMCDAIVKMCHEKPDLDPSAQFDLANRIYQRQPAADIIKS